MNNIGYMFSRPGILKSATLVIGLIMTSIIGHAYDRSFYNNFYKVVQAVPELKDVPAGEKIENMGKEGYFLSIAVIFFLLSLAFFICHLITEELSKSPGAQFFDAGYHSLGALLIFIGACLVMSSAVNINKEKDEVEAYLASMGLKVKLQYKSEKIVSGVFGLINSILYGLTAWVTFIGSPQPAQ